VTSITPSLTHFFTTLAVAFGLVAPPAAPPQDLPTFTILCYHTFDSRKPNSYTVSSSRFNEQMRYLWIQKIPVISLSEAVSYVRSGKPIPDRSVVITIDDGYKTARTVAWPILQKYGFPFTLYVYPAAISHLHGSMTWDDLRYLSAMGVDIESHTMTHPLLTHPGKAMNPKEYEAWLSMQLLDSRKMIEDHLHKPVRHLAYSYGGYDDYVVARAEAAGYESATTCNNANVTRRVKPLLMDRRLIFSQTTFKSFTQGLRARELTLTDRSPHDGQRIKDLPKEISAQVLNRDQINPDTLRLHLDYLRGWQPVQYDRSNGKVRFQIPAMAHRGYFYVSLVAQDKNLPTLQRQATWLFITSKNKSKK